MAVNTQFSIAVHLLAGLAYGCNEGATSARLAKSVNTSPSFVRRTLAKLSKAGLLETTTGKAGSCRLARQPGRVTFLDVYRAVNAPRAIAIHAYAPQKNCPVSCNIKLALEKLMTQPQRALESSLSKITIQDVLVNLKP